MKQLIYFFSVILLAVIAGLFAHEDSGYILIGRGHYTLETSLTLFLTLLIFSFIILYLLIRFIVTTWHVPAGLRSWRSDKRSAKARRGTLKGLVELAQGNWHKAERKLIQHAQNSDMPILNYLSAARAAQKQQANDRRDRYLANAYESMPDADFAVKLTQAELQMANGQNEQSLATLVHLHGLRPKHPHVLGLLAKLYEKVKSWDDLNRIFPELRKQKIFAESILDDLQRDTNIALIRKVVRKDQHAQLQQLWESIPRSLRRDHYLLSIYASKLLELEQHDQAEQLLRETLRKSFDPVLVRIYGKIRSSQPEKQLSFCETLLRGQEQQPVLLLSLGRISMHNDLWGKARSYFEASLGALESAETYRELGQLMEYLNEASLASEYYKKGLLLAAREINS